MTSLEAQVADLCERYSAARKKRFPPYSMTTLGAHAHTVKQFRAQVLHHIEQTGELPSGTLDVYRHPKLGPFCALEFSVDLHALGAPASSP